MSITIARSPIVLASFLQQTCLDDEYFRKYKPNGDRYTNDDDLGHYNYHLGFDFSRLGRPDTLYAVCDGIVEHVNVSSSFGLQMALRSRASRYREAAFYAHCETRIADGTRVVAGRSIGKMGTTGGVPEHLHFSWLGDWTSRVAWRNPGPALRSLKYAYLHPSQPIPGGGDDVTEEEVRKIVREEVQRAVAFIMSGTWSDTFPQEVPWTNRDDYSLDKLMREVRT